jgi:hypothetical protein
MTDAMLNTGCQAQAQDEFTASRSPGWLFGPMGLLPRVRRVFVVWLWAFRYLRDRGFVFTLRKSCAFSVFATRQRLRPVPKATWKTPVAQGSVLDLKPGDWVEVKPLEEILPTLDSNGKTFGLFFTNEMKLHCGKRYHVFKRVNSIFNEFTGEQRNVRNTVLLETVFCRGEGLGCDRSCFHMWREVWLRRIPVLEEELSSNSRMATLPILTSSNETHA